MSITRRIEIIKKEFIMKNFLVDDFVVYVFYIRISKKHNENLKNVHKIKKVQISVVLQKKKTRKKQKIEISKKWQHIEKSFKKNLVYELSKHDFSDYVIDLEKEAQFLYDFIYFLFELKLKVFKAYIKKHLTNNFIRLFKSLINALILFVKKKNDNFRLCVNYRGFNQLTIKNRYFLLLIEKSLDRFSRVIVYSKFDIILIYHRMKIKKENE